MCSVDGAYNIRHYDSSKKSERQHTAPASLKGWYHKMNIFSLFAHTKKKSVISERALMIFNGIFLKSIRLFWMPLLEVIWNIYGVYLKVFNLRLWIAESALCFQTEKTFWNNSYFERFAFVGLQTPENRTSEVVLRKV
jgi:hypothetical protein